MPDMNGQMRKSKRQIVEEYVKRVNPYEKQPPIAFDLRGYAKYVAEKGLEARDITPEIIQMFSKAKETLNNSSSAL